MATEDKDVPTTRSRRTRKGRPSSPVSLLRLASSPAARTAYVVLGALGLVALAVAVVGPKRVRREVLEPLRDAIEPHAAKAWAEARPLRDQIAALLEKASPAGREQLARNFQSWIGHFRAG
jgi:hypothetical protein